MGEGADWMLLTRWEDRLHEPLSKVRKELGFGSPKKYQTVLRQYEEWVAQAESIAA